MSTRQRTGTLVVTLLTAALALGACSEQRTASKDNVEQAQSAHARVAGEAQQAAASTAQRLRQVRALYPTAGLEVPPAGLHARASVEEAVATGAYALHVRSCLTTPGLTQPGLTQRHAEWPAVVPLIALHR